MNCSVIVTDGFQKSAKRLFKKHKSLKRDLGKLINELERNPYAGSRLSSHVYKVRLAITSKGKGKSGGARVITYVNIEIESQEETDDVVVYLLDIYDKSEISNIPSDVVKAYEQLAVQLEEE